MRFTSKPIAEHVEVPLADEGRWEQLVEHWERRDAPVKRRSAEGNACYVVSIRMRDDDASSENKLAEIVGLVRAQGDRIVGHESHRLSRPDPRTLLGRGLSVEIATRALDSGADLLVLDAELSPSQMRNLEEAAGLAVCDREAVILNVFLRHAKTRRARIQVEVAQLEYLRPRIRGLGLEMDQQAGGVMRARGPGETASELMARRLDARLAELRRALTKLRRSSTMRRRGRARCARLALVGYTNAGKTSLMNALTGAGLSARDSPFETLDTTSRCLTRHGGDVILSDTVGFIRSLPRRLLASFESTLGEIGDATLLVMVVDVSDSEWQLHLATTEAILMKLGVEQLPRCYVFNKLDRLSQPPADEELRRYTHDHPFVALSSRDGRAVAQLRRVLIALARGERQIARVFVAYDAKELMAMLYARCRILATEPREHGLRLTIEAEPHTIARIRRAGQRA